MFLYILILNLCFFLFSLHWPIVSFCLMLIFVQSLFFFPRIFFILSILFVITTTNCLSSRNCDLSSEPLVHSCQIVSIFVYLFNFIHIISISKIHFQKRTIWCNFVLGTISVKMYFTKMKYLQLLHELRCTLNLGKIIAT